MTKDHTEPMQILIGNSLTYITKDGWQDSSQILVGENEDGLHKGGRADKFYSENIWFSVLINKYLGLGYFKLSSNEQKAAFKQAAEKFKQDKILKHGSLYNYFLYRLKSRGFETENQYRKYMAKQLGFNSRYDLFNYWAKKKGFKSYYEQKLYNLKKRGFRNQKEYRDWLCKKHGVKNLDQLTKLRKEKKNEIKR